MAASSPTKKASRSGNPAKRATAQTWKRNLGEDVTLPSQNVCLARRPGPAAILGEGILPDELAPIISEAVSKGKGLRPQKAQEILDKPEGLLMMMEAMDKVTAMVVIEPKVRFHKYSEKDATDENGVVDASLVGTVIPMDARDSDFVYTDEVDIEDKMFLFQYAVGGTRDYVRFREESSSGLGDLLAGSGGVDTPE